MSDSTTTPAAAPAAYNPNAMSPEHAASARETWVNAGLDPTAFDAAVSGITPSAAPSGDATPAVPAAGAPNLPPPSISPEQAATLADNLEKLGRTEAEIANTLAGFGYQADPRTEEQRAWDNRWGFGDQHAPAEYALDHRASGLIGSKDITEQAQVTGNWQGLLAALQINPAVGTDLAERIIANTHALGEMGAAERGLWQAEQKARAASIAGSPEAFTEVNRLAGLAIKHMLDNGADAGHVDAMLKSGAIGWYELHTLANHGRALEGWSAGRPA